MSFGSHSRLARAVTISKAVLVADETLLRSRKSESLKTTIERGHEYREACGRAWSNGSGSRQLTLLEAQRKVGDDYTSGCRGECRHGGVADGVSNRARR